MDLSELGVSYYEIGGKIQTSTVSSESTVVAVQDVPVIADVVPVRSATPYDVCYAPAEQPQRHVPYSYGSPLVNLGVNALLYAVSPHVRHTNPGEIEGPV